MSYFIVPPTQYFDETAANLATPERFNAIFNLINQEAVSRHGFIYPIMINLSHTNVALEQNGTPHPSSIIFQEIGSSLAPINDQGATLYNIEYAWSLAFGSVGSFTGATSGDTIEVDISGATHTESDFVGVDLTVTYLNIDQSTYKTLSTSIAVPFVAMGQDGAPAITVPIPTIYAPFNHQPLSWLEPNSEDNAVAKITAYNHSFVPAGWGSYEAAWTLVDSSGNDFGQYITSQDTTEVSLEIPDADKHYTLTLTITDDGYSTTFTTSVDLFTYGPGVFFLQWGQNSDIPQTPKFVTLEGIPLTHENKLFPEQEGSMEVKWGFDSIDFGSIGIMNYTGQLGSQPNSDFIAGAFAAAGIAEPTTEDEWGTYALVNLDGSNVTEELTSWFLFIGNQGMIRQAEIIADVSASNSLWGSIFQKSKSYLVSGFTLGQTPNGFFDNNVSIASKFERSAIELKHYSMDISTGALAYAGQYDQIRVVSPSQAKLPIRTTFHGVPNGVYFHASVSAAIGSSYSTLTNSYGSSVPTPNDAGIVELSEARPISSVVIDGEQYGVKVDITLGDGATTPVGYLVSYREFASASTIDPGLVPSFDPLSSDYSVLFKKSRTFNLSAKLGRKVKVWVKTVMGDGAVSDPVASAEVVVQFPSSFEQSLLREHLGRFQGTTPANVNLWEETWEPEGGASGHSQYTVAYATFGKKTELQGVNVWVHSLAGATPDHWDLVLSVGGSGGMEHYDIGQGAADPSNIDSSAITYDTSKEPILFYLDDLSITTEAGTPLGVNFRKNSATGTPVGNLLGAAYDISVELTYSFPFDAEE